MKKLISITSVLFTLHTIEEAVTSFWKTDASVLISANVLHLDPGVFYWLAQLVLYVILLHLILLPLKKYMRVFYKIIGLILVLEFHHLWAAISVGTYTSGLYTGTLLGLLSIYYWITYMKLSYKK